MPGKFIYRPRLSDMIASATPQVAPAPQAASYASGARPAPPSAVPAMPPQRNTSVGPTIARPTIARPTIARPTIARPTIVRPGIVRPGIVTTPPAAAAVSSGGARPVAKPGRKAPPKKYVSSTHYARYILWQGRQNSELIIESHGLRVIDERRHVLPANMTLHFYGPDGAALATPTIDYAFLERGLAEHPYERIKGGQRYLDYTLSKFELPPERGKDTLYHSFMNCLDRYDVLSLEQLDDDGPTESLRLSQVIAHLVSQGHRYARIHCIFCRSISRQDILRHPSLEQLVKPDYAPLK